MSNKKIFKEIYSNKINKDKNYQEILKRIEKTQNKNNILKKSLVPVTSILAISFLIILNLNIENKPFHKNTPLIDTYEDYNVTTSQKDESSTNNSKVQDSDIKIINVESKKIVNQDKYSLLNNIKIPSDLNLKIYQAIYTKKTNEKEYNNLYNYSFKYQHPKENRNIIISFSDKYQPLRDYLYSNNKQVKTFNNTQIIYYQNKTSYIIIFTYNNINFDIETNNITKEELTNLLTSIIK